MTADPFSAITSFEALAARVQAMRVERFSERVWNGCALAGKMDPSLYKFLAKGSAKIPAFEDFVAEPDLELVDEKHHVYRLRRAARDRYFALWQRNDPELQKLSKEILDFSGPKGDDFTLLAVANPAEAKRQFDAVYAEADAAFDLSRCEALIDELRSRSLLLSDELRLRLEQREDYLETRTLFMEDYYRTVSYLHREQVFDQVAEFLTGKRRLLNLYGSGGAGKTVFLRWLIARQCVPERSKLRTPVARLDIDYLYRALLIQQPWLTLLSMAAQLTPQIPGNVFQDLMRPEETALRNRLHNRSPVLRASDAEILSETGFLHQGMIEDKFASALANRNALVIIDTIEELWLHYPAVLGGLLAVLDKIQSRCPNLRVLLSGRYPVFDQTRELKGLSEKRLGELKKQCGQVELTIFSPAESRKFLVQLRHLDSEKQPIEEIIKASRGNPFTLALFAELGSSRTLSKEEVRNAKVQFAYLIERIIDRIPDEEVLDRDTDIDAKRKRTQSGLRWFLRYGVVQRRLTKDFAQSVVFPYVRQALLGANTPDDANDLTLAGPKYEGTPRWHARGEIGFGDLWTALQSYASTSSWISGSDDALVLQPEIVVPMRQLLTQTPEKYPIFRVLNESAAAYFESQAMGDRVGEALSNALLHRFQAEGQAAGSWLADYLNVCRASDGQLAAVQEVADSLFSYDYSDDERRPVKHMNGLPIVTQATLAQAKLEVFLAAMMREIRDPEVVQTTPHSSLETQYADLREFAANPQDARMALVLYAARVLRLSDASAHARPVHLDELDDPNEKVAAGILMARELQGKDSRKSLQLQVCEIAAKGYSELLNVRATGIAARRPRMFLPPYFVQSEFARLDLLSGNTEEAFAGFRAAFDSAFEANAKAKEISELMLKIGDLGYLLGHCQAVEECAVRAVTLPFPSREESTGWLLRSAIDRFDLDGAQVLANEFETDVSAAREEYIADAAAAMFRFSEAESHYLSANSGYVVMRYISAASIVLIKHAAFCLDVLGSVDQSVQRLKPLQLFPEPIVEVESCLLRLRQCARQADVVLARSFYERALELPRNDARIPETVAMIARAIWVAEGLGDANDENKFLELFSHSTPGVQLASLRPFLHSRPEARAKSANGLPGNITLEGGWDAQSLWAASGLIFFGQEVAALEVLERLKNSRTANFHLLGAAYRIASRISPAALPHADDWLQQCIERAATHPEYAAVLLIEAGERLLAAGATQELQQCWEPLRNLQSYFPLDSSWSNRMARLASAVGSRDAAGELVSSLAQLRPEQLLQTVNMITVTADLETKRIRLEGSGSSPGESMWAYSESGSRNCEILLRAVRKADLYPAEYATTLRVSAGAVVQWIADFWYRLTRHKLETSGVERLRSNLEKLWQEARARSFTLQDTAVQARDSALGAVPWELVRRGSNRFYRTVQGAPLPDTLRWMRRAVETLGMPSDTSGPSVWAAFMNQIGGPENFRRTLLERIPRLDPRSGRSVLLIDAGAELQRRRRRSYGAGGLRLDREYTSLGFVAHSLRLDSDSLLNAKLEYNCPSIVHITAQVAESFTPREAYLFAGESSKPVRVEALSHLFSQWSEHQLRPFVILEAVDNPFDRGRTLLLRNAFANRLFRENTRGVIAIGPYPTESLSRTISSLLSVLNENDMAIADLHKKFWSSEADPAPALFTLDPDLPVWD
jgi:hypothetical protein